jgi:ribonuclease BN (tRNA processing enzyme)
VKLTLIPSSVSGCSDQHQFLSSTLVNDTIAVDAGCIGFYHSPPEQARVRHVLLSHTHMDHLASLPIFVENAYEGTSQCVTIHASREVLDCCRRDLFNDRLWPDFVELSKSGHPFLKLAPFEAGETIELDGVRVTAVALDHVVPTVAFMLSDDHSTVAVVSDTAPSTAIWERLNAAPNLKAVFLETTFPNELDWLARVSKHLTPALVAGELKKLNRTCRVIIVHIKARFHEQVVRELQALHLPNLEIGRTDLPYQF